MTEDSSQLIHYCNDGEMSQSQVAKKQKPTHTNSQPNQQQLELKQQQQQQSPVDDKSPKNQQELQQKNFIGDVQDSVRESQSKNQDNSNIQQKPKQPSNKESARSSALKQQQLSDNLNLYENSEQINQNQNKDQQPNPQSIEQDKAKINKQEYYIESGIPLNNSIKVDQSIDPYLKITVRDCQRKSESSVYIVGKDGMEGTQKNTNIQELIIGRKEANQVSCPCDIDVQHQNFSRIHCKIDFRSGLLNCQQDTSNRQKFKIVDVGSLCGTFVKLEEKIYYPLKEKQVFLLGDNIHLIVNNVSEQKIQDSTNQSRVQHDIQFTIKNLDKITLFEKTFSVFDNEKEKQFKIGRNQENNCVIADKAVSNMHCTLKYEIEKGWSIADGNGIDKFSSFGTALSLKKDGEDQSAESKPFEFETSCKIKISTVDILIEAKNNMVE